MMLVFGDSSKRLEAEMPLFLYKYFCQTQSRIMKGLVYCYHCISTGKKYIGKTINEEKRKIRHKHDCKRGVDNKFYRAVRKYGWDNFIYGIVDEYNVDILNEQEMYYIDCYDTYHNGYNSTIGGEGVSGFSQSKESRKKMSESAKNRDKTPYLKYFTEEEKREAKRKRDREYQQRVKERRKEYMKEWGKNNKEKRKEYQKKYQQRVETKEKRKVYNKEFRKNNKEYMKEWRENNREYLREYMKEWRKRKKCDT